MRMPNDGRGPVGIGGLGVKVEGIGGLGVKVERIGGRELVGDREARDRPTDRQGTAGAGPAG
jgi:hypothetical protein